MAFNSWIFILGFAAQIVFQVLAKPQYGCCPSPCCPPPPCPPPVQFVPVPQPVPINVAQPCSQSVTIPNIILALLPPSKKCSSPPLCSSPYSSSYPSSYPSPYSSSYSSCCPPPPPLVLPLPQPFPIINSVPCQPCGC